MAQTQMSHVSKAIILESFNDAFSGTLKTKQKELQIFHSLNARDLTMFFNVDRAPTWFSAAGATTLRNTLDTNAKYEQDSDQKIAIKVMKENR